MKTNPIPGLILCLLAALLLLLPCTPYGKNLVQDIFPSVNFREESLLSSRPGSGQPDPASPGASLPQEEAPDIRDAEEDRDIYTTVLLEELPGEYLLVTLFTPEETIPEDTLSAIHRIGIPLRLTIREDGSAELQIFDQSSVLQLDLGSLQLTADGVQLPFFYHAGRLTVQEGRSYLVFEKQ